MWVVLGFFFYYKLKEVTQSFFINTYVAKCHFKRILEATIIDIEIDQM